MRTQGAYMVERDREGKLPNAKLGQWPRIYKDLEQNIVNKYSLIQWNDIVPHLTEQLLGEVYKQNYCWLYIKK